YIPTPKLAVPKLIKIQKYKKYAPSTTQSIRQYKRRKNNGVQGNHFRKRKEKALQYEHLNLPTDCNTKEEIRTELNLQYCSHHE
ncbi:unnamed protein product, partial [Ceratitis capitata]